MPLPVAVASGSVASVARGSHEDVFGVSSDCTFGQILLHLGSVKPACPVENLESVRNRRVADGEHGVARLARAVAEVEFVRGVVVLSHREVVATASDYGGPVPVCTGAAVAEVHSVRRVALYSGIDVLPVPKQHPAVDQTNVGGDDRAHHAARRDSRVAELVRRGGGRYRAVVFEVVRPRPCGELLAAVARAPDEVQLRRVVV